MRDFYSWYTHDEYIEVPDSVAAELLADKRYEAAYWRRVYYNKAQYSLDAGDGIEHEAIPSGLSLDAMLEHNLTICDLCRALNSLPEIQGRRIEAHYICGRSVADIARAEGVAQSRIYNSIGCGIKNLKKFFK